MRAPPHTPAQRTAARTLALTATLTLTLALSGCDPGSTPHRPRATATTPSAAPTASLIQACTRLIAYWAEQELTGGEGAGLDWEQKGLSNEQREIYDAIVHAAHAERDAHGTDAAHRLIKRQAEQRCTAANGATYSSDNWRPPT
ncbi:hypothetical protein AB0I22_24770 [Streptomyces sp. NPDC050610]|uniref:hypothetical protein n=1 Tax=Streptomyces sp. NPDC050610 TaxID=3157097 RepID=UPI00343D1D36